MTNVPYNTNIPFASNSPSQDQPRMQENTNSLKSLIEIDHVGFGNNQGGYHKTIHEPVVPVGGQTAWDPLIGSAGRLAVEATKIAGVQQLFPLFYTPDTTGGTADTQLFSLTGNGGINQLTGSASSSTDGWCWLGGILIQWGTIVTAVKNVVTNVNFKDRFSGAIPFPNNCFNIVGTFSLLPAASSNPTLVIAPVDKTKFQYNLSTSSSSTAFNIMWVAIGN